MKILARWVRVVVVDPDANLLPAMRAGAFGLKQGRVLILYPEGERSIDGAPKVFKKGAAILSMHMQVPIVPIAIDGFYEAWPRGKSFFQKRTHMKMRIGDPVDTASGVGSVRRSLRKSYGGSEGAGSGDVGRAAREVRRLDRRKRPIRVGRR